ncbi:MAG: amidase [Beijerinckiaceae bacterium]
MTSTNPLIDQSATEIVALLKLGAITPHDCLDALAARIAEVDPKVNALPTLCMERARAAAHDMLAKPMAERGVLAGLPVAIKDLTEVKGVRTTHGSPIFADNISEASDILVEHLEGQGGIVYAKSNTPEFGAGAQTFNEVFGATRNPWNTSRSAAGSSGGAAVALATGMAWLAHGSDLGGSLRNPASFCGVVGLRPTPGRVAHSPGLKIDSRLSVEGPMGRSVEDVALFLDAMVGEDARDAVSLPAPTGSYLAAARSGWKPLKVAYSADLGITPVDPEVAAITRAAAQRLQDVGVIVEEAHPDFSGAHECFQTLRALGFAISRKHLLEQHRDKLKPEVIWNIEKGLNLTADQIIRAETTRAAIIKRAFTFFETYDLLLCPATIVAAFPIEQRYLESCNGVRFESYVDWLAVVYAITLVGAPAMSLPAGFTREGLPIGLQIVAPPRGEARIFAAARLLEGLLDLGSSRPIDPRVGT